MFKHTWILNSAPKNSIHDELGSIINGPFHVKGNWKLIIKIPNYLIYYTNITIRLIDSDRIKYLCKNKLFCQFTNLFSSWLQFHLMQFYCFQQFWRSKQGCHFSVIFSCFSYFDQKMLQIRFFLSIILLMSISYFFWLHVLVCKFSVIFTKSVWHPCQRIGNSKCSKDMTCGVFTQEKASCLTLSKLAC